MDSRKLLLKVICKSLLAVLFVVGLVGIILM
jgi:hypothetical protein